MGSCVGRDHCIVGANGRTGLCQLGPKLPRVGGGGAIEVEDFQASEKPFDYSLVAGGRR
ncbi:hypothetical protein D3C87_2009550 [compost metagenome]